MSIRIFFAWACPCQQLKLVYFLIKRQLMDVVMNKYGRIALLSAEVLKKKKFSSPSEAWKFACQEVEKDINFTIKSCPRTTFLGLCSEGEINCVPHGDYTKSSCNKKYGMDAIRLIREKPYLMECKKQLWAAVAGENKSHNQQMDVVISLCKNGYINL